MKLFAALDPKDRKLLIITICVVVALATVLGIFSRNQNNDNNPLPGSYLTGKHGAHAAYDLLQASGYDIQRWEQPLSLLAAQADSTTVVIFAEPNLTSPSDLQSVRKIVERGGRVLLTGFIGGALAPDSDVLPPSQFQTNCALVPQGFDPLATSGAIWMAPEAAWGSNRPRDRVQYNCAGTPAVVEYSFVSGHVVWWAGSTPLENGSIERDGNMSLLLNSLGPRDGRKFYWDESLHGEVASEWSYASGPALTLLLAGLTAIGLLTVLSFGRRRGPIRDLPAPIRTTPVEFLEALGSLYAEAGAAVTSVALAYERFQRKAGDLCGIKAAQMTAEDLARALRRRFPQAAPSLEKDLQECEAALKEDKLPPKRALVLVQTLSLHLETLEKLARARVA